MTTETKEVLAIDNEVLEASNAIQPRLQFNDEGVFEVTGEQDDLFMNFLDEELRPYVDKLDERKALFRTALTHAVGKTGTPVLKERGLKRVSGTVKMGKDVCGVNITAPSGKRADGTSKDPIVTTVTRVFENENHGRVRSDIYNAWRSLND